MGFFEMKPLLPWASIESPRKDLKDAVTVEQYKVGHRAVFIPAKKMSWEYIPLTEIRALITEQLPEEAGDFIDPFTRKRPLVRLMYKGGAEVLYLDKQQNANRLIDEIREKQQELKERKQK